MAAKKIPYVSIAGPVNMAGGQPFSMKNLRDVYKLCESHKIKLWFDATRAVENAYFIKTRERGYAKKSIAAILLEMTSYFEGIWVSAKKDLIGKHWWNSCNKKTKRFLIKPEIWLLFTKVSTPMVV